MNQSNENESGYLLSIPRRAQAAAIACSACDASSATPPMTIANPTTYRAISAGARTFGAASAARMFNIICDMIVTPSTKSVIQ
ncbi:MAG: hypothetical protein IOC39_09440 [Burkholderia sp.]|jgi:hypothetical protein|uniref:hypothetical protein n=1 Tax=Burkholderia sp. TaxID=36773 RepID=UPI002584BD45|nr:hypothetical protein [Burkholderia sp.]MCA3777304.1 hypothetical protein [Burkholderia sp.]MCA3790468.1 hypothetical protein [Burkholderia sp.]MCA3797186.1 hypothetical protein [Burkholderia sp.]MCA3801178.1 hypothetical protein [Burkholderia sp.]MCA3807453.1 hypothetical protein [Burkholderia sp.]